MRGDDGVEAVDRKRGCYALFYDWEIVSCQLVRVGFLLLFSFLFLPP